MKTIKTLAGEIGVTKQAVFQRMKKEPLASGLNNLITRVDGKVYVCPEAEGMIKDQFYKTQRAFAAYCPQDSVQDLADTLRDSLNTIQCQIAKKDRHIDILNLHISIKNRQIDKLNGQIENLSTALNIAQEQAKSAQALHAGDIQRGIMEIMTRKKESEKKKGFWRKVSKDKNSD